MTPFHVLGGVGLLLISVGVLLRKRDLQDELYLVGGICLEVYSVYLRDPIFIVLQAVFILAALYDVVKRKMEGSRDGRIVY